VILDLNTSDKVAENGLAEFLYVSNRVNPLKSIFIFSKSSGALIFYSDSTGMVTSEKAVRLRGRYQQELSTFL